MRMFDEVSASDLDMSNLFSEFHISEELTESEQVSRFIEIDREIYVTC